MPRILISGRAGITNQVAHFICGPSLWYITPPEAVFIAGGNMPIESSRRLYQPSELPGVLQLTQEQIEWLTNTGQLNPICIAGEVRFDSRDISQLIDAYKAVGSRRSR